MALRKMSSYMPNVFGTAKADASNENGAPKVPGAKGFTTSSTTAAQPLRSVLGDIGNIAAATTDKTLARKASDPSRPLKTRKLGSEETAGGSTLGFDTAEPQLGDFLHCDIAPMDLGESPEQVELGVPEGVDDIDAEDPENPLLVAEYVQEIYKYMRELEIKYAVDPNYMSQQKYVEPKMRAILVDWMTEVLARFRQLQETLYLAVTIMDRFMARNQISRQRMQLVGVASMLLASKYEETYNIAVGDLMKMADMEFSREKILEMEEAMLVDLDYSFSNPLSLNFLRRFTRAARADAYVHNVAKFMLELGLGASEMLAHMPSMQAAAAIYLGMRVMNGTDSWNQTMEHYTGYTRAEIEPCVRDMYNVFKASETAKQRAVRRKYTSKTRYAVTSLPEVVNFTM